MDGEKGGAGPIGPKVSLGDRCIPTRFSHHSGSFFYWHTYIYTAQNELLTSHQTVHLCMESPSMEYVVIAVCNKPRASKEMTVRTALMEFQAEWADLAKR